MRSSKWEGKESRLKLTVGDDQPVGNGANISLLSNFELFE
jgi:hypothetical protein